MTTLNQIAATKKFFFFFFCLITGQEDIQRNWAYNINFKSINVAYIETMSLHLLVWRKAQSIGLNSKICNKTHNILTIVSPIYYKWTNIFPSITKFIWEDESQKNVTFLRLLWAFTILFFFFNFMNFYFKKKKTNTMFFLALNSKSPHFYDDNIISKFWIV